MSLTLTLLLCLSAVALNLPFGFYRAGVRKFSWRWFLAIHLPVPLIIAVRIFTGAGWSIVPLLIGCAIIGQLMGGLARTSAKTTGRQRLAAQMQAEKDES